MRISDWSSDVCSSDLVEGEEMRDHLPGGGGEIAVEQACRARGLHCAGPVALRFGERQEVELERRLDQPGGEVGAFDVEADPVEAGCRARQRSEEHTSELQSLMRISYAVFCLKKKNQPTHTHSTHTNIHDDHPN